MEYGAGVLGGFPGRQVGQKESRQPPTSGSTGLSRRFCAVLQIQASAERGAARSKARSPVKGPRSQSDRSTSVSLIRN